MLQKMLKSNIVFFLLFFQLFSVSSQTQELVKRNYLINQYQEKGKSAAFLDVNVWRANKKEKIDAEIAALPATVKLALIKQAEDLVKDEWSVLKVTDYLDYVRTGSRQQYSNSQRQNKLTSLVIAELVDGKGKFMPEIINGLWLTLEESTWNLPAHLVLQKAGAGLPDPNEVIVTLHSGDIATTVSWIRFLLYDELKNISPMLITRIDYELANRIFNPFLSRSDMKWMGFTTRKTNNWNTWINSNILTSAILTIDDDKFRNRVIEKNILSVDNFLNQYPEDGGIDEGITYWKHAGGRLIEFISLLADFSGNKLDWRNNELIHKIGSYVYKTHIQNNQFVNFADASALNIPLPFYVYKYGELFNDLILKKFSSYLYQLEHPDGNKFDDSNLNTFIHNIETHNKIEAYPAESPMLKQNWLPDLQVLTLRETQGSVKGLFFAAKGGHNGESHNHNDVGNFVLYTNGKPVVIDVGVGTYTRQTFSKDRYKLWFMQSQWHNCSSINGVEQKSGSRYKAEQVKYFSNAKATVFSFDMASAYPKEAKVNSWNREFIFSSKKGNLILNEKYALEEYLKPSEIYFITPMLVKKAKEGSLKIYNGNDGVLLNYDPSLFDVIIENKKVTDGKLSTVWGSEVKRIIFKSRSTLKTGSHSFKFSGID